MVVKWSLDQPDEGELMVKVPNSVYALKWIYELNALLVAQNQEGIHWIDLEQKKELRSLKLTNQSIFDLLYIDKKLWIAEGQGRIQVVDLEKWTVINQLTHSQASVRTLTYNPLTQEVAAGYSDYTIRIYSSKDYQLKKEILAHNNSVFSLRYSSDSQYLLSGSRDAHLKIWNVNQEYSLKESIVAHLFTINHIQYRQDGKYFATCSKDKSIKVWDSERFKLLKVIDKARHAGHGTSVNKLLWLGNEHLASCSDDRTISIWKLEFLI
jgi:WD40 repeat protein